MITLQPINICQAAADLLWSRVIKDFPGIRFALSEGGTGWIPYFLDRIDRTYDMHHLWTGQDFGVKRPSEVFRHRAPEQCTVGALRAEAGDHDVSIRSRDTGRFEKSVGIEIGKLAGVSTT